MIGKNIIRLKEVNSTNQYASQIIKKGNIDEGTVIITSNQTSGKGQAENKWESEKGLNLTFSIILTPSFLPIDKQFLISKISSLAVLGFLKKLFVENASIKWPNDIYIGRSKIAGILIENSIKGETIDTTIIGIGININQTQFSSEIPNPTSLKMLFNKNLDLNECLDIFLQEINEWYNLLKFNNYSFIDKEYLNSLYVFNKWSQFNYLNQKITARIKGVSKYGKLLLEKEDGNNIECDLKEIKYLI